MNTKNFKNHLNKLVRVFASIEEDGEITNLERDLLKKYVVNLYEALTQEEKSDSKSEHISSSNSKTDKVKEPIEANLETRKVVDHVEQNSESTEAIVMPEVILEKKTEPIVLEKVAEVKQAVIQELKVDLPFRIPSDLAEIFEEEKASEISEKLGLSKVKDIGKAMGINEKIFTITELFGGDQALFNDTVQNLNDCNSYAEASKYICESVARTKNWAEPDKVKKAKQFVKLVQRKFS